MVEIANAAAPLDLTATWMGVTALVVFVLAYAVVVGEEFLHIRKSMPVLVAYSRDEDLATALDHLEATRGIKDVPTTMRRRMRLGLAQTVAYTSPLKNAGRS